MNCKLLNRKFIPAGTCVAAGVHDQVWTRLPPLGNCPEERYTVSAEREKTVDLDLSDCGAVLKKCPGPDWWRWETELILSSLVEVNEAGKQQYKSESNPLFTKQFFHITWI